jgi:competence protein ComEC
MLFWKRFPFIRITGAFCSGIWTGYNLKIPVNLLIGLTILMLFLYFLMNRYLVRKNFRKFNILISLLAFATIFLCGSLLIRLKNVQAERTLDMVSTHSSNCYMVRALQWTGSTEKYNKLLAELLFLGSGETVQPVHGKILLYVPPETSINYGNHVLIRGKPLPFGDPVFPLEFNYREYMFRRGILFQQFLKLPDFRVMDERSKVTLPSFAFRMRETLISRVHERIKDPRVQALMIALTTGNRDYFDQETYNEFMEAGIVHILAVSGLHIGIVYYLLLLLTRPLSLNPYLRWIRLIIIIMVFLFTALFTGLAPSVLRSVVMFTMISMGNTIDRKTPVLNSVALSAFFLLCYDPGFLWQVGFQLSYSAVMGIILFQPMIKTFLNPGNRLLQWTWNLTTVSLSAQLTTLPFSLFYFKQFPTYFLIANFFAIPFAGIFIPGCILFNFIYAFTWLSHWISFILEHIAILFFQVIHLVNKLPGSLIHPVNAGLPESILIFLLIFFLYITLKIRKYRIIFIMFFILIPIILKDSYEYFKGSATKKILVYTIRGSPVVEMIDGHHAFILIRGNRNPLMDGLKFHVDNYHIRHNIRYEILVLDKLPENVPCLKTADALFVFWNGKTIALVESNTLPSSPEWPGKHADLVIGMAGHQDLLMLPGTEQQDNPGNSMKVISNGIIRQIRLPPVK